MCKRPVARLLLVLGAVSTLCVADCAPSHAAEPNGFENVKKPKLYFYQKMSNRPGKVLWQDWGYVEPMAANGVPGLAVFRGCGLEASDAIPRIVKVTDLREEDDKGDKGDGVCLSNSFTDSTLAGPLDLWIEIYSVKASGPSGATLDTIISFRDIDHHATALPDTVSAEEWNHLGNQYGGEIPVGTYLGRSAFGHFFLVAASAADIRP